MANSNPQDPMVPVDPAFAFHPGGSLQPAAGSDRQSVWRHLSAQVARDALDLEAHVRRVTVAADAGEAGQTLTALVDLFLALGPKGKGLRAQMLRRAEKVLGAEEVEYLRQNLDGGLSRGMDLPLGVYAVLDPGLMHASAMVRHSRATAAEMTLLEQASALLDQGDLAAARTLLEDALMQTPDDAAISSELMAIYRASRDHQAMAEMRERLAARHGKVPESWV